MWMMWIGLVALASDLDEARAARDTAGRGTPAQQAAAGDAVVHEWGTFTSAHRPDGQAVYWFAGTDTHPLPDFVVRGVRSGKTAFDGPVACNDPEAALRPKADCHATIRMETPVIYVHVPAPARMRVVVDFPDGQHTEWFPSVRGVQAGNLQHLDWGWMTATPHDDAPLPSDGSHSPYYAARAVDAATLQVDDERERFLFYRGVATFTPPASPVTTDDAVRWDGRGAEAMVVFERRGNRSGATLLTGAGEVRRADLNSGNPRTMLRELLLARGLYADEVEAMLATWEAEWFEPGLRAFTLLDDAEVARRLPLSITPRPKELLRVMVARSELFSPAQIEEARGMDQAAQDERFGRFAEAIRSAMEEGVAWQSKGNIR